MARTAEQIAELFFTRRRNRGAALSRMHDITALYEGTIPVDLPELVGDERAAVVNYAKIGINQMGMRLGSQLPNIKARPIDFGNREYARKQAELRRKVWLTWWHENRMQLKMRLRGRWLFAYAAAPVIIRPDFEKNIPRWYPKTPLHVYPAAVTSLDDIVPSDVICASSKSVGWLKSYYPEQAQRFSDEASESLVDVLEFIDHDEIHLIVCGRVRTRTEIEQGLYGGPTWDQQGYNVFDAYTLRKVPNRAGRPLAVCPNGLALDKPIGQYDGLIGMHQAQARLQALGMIARQRGVFQEVWIATNDDKYEPRILQKADPTNGVPGMAVGNMTRAQIDPQFATDNGIDRLSESMRVEGGIPADFSGQAASNVRTGKRADQLIGQSVDPLLEEAHDLMQVSLEEENRIATAVDKGFWGGMTRRIFVSFPGDTGHKSYTPEKLWDTDAHEVVYPFAGQDMAQITITAAQAVGVGILSKRHAAEIHPLVDDPEAEFDRITVERMRDALLDGVMMQLQTPGAGIEPIDAAWIIKNVGDDSMEIEDAVIKVHEARQRAQATPNPDPAAQQPGISPAGAGVEAPPVIPGAGAGVGDLNSLLMSLTGPQLAAKTINRTAA